jgi:5-(carboxyamino)imidazole ribonucleotide synthase
MPTARPDSIADRHFRAGYDDYAALDEFAQAVRRSPPNSRTCRPTPSITWRKFVPVRPSAAAVAVCQNRIAEKSFLRDNGFPHGPFAAIRNEHDIKAASAALFPAILKVARFGYDGKGQATVNNRDEALLALPISRAKPASWSSAWRSTTKFR